MKPIIRCRNDRWTVSVEVWNDGQRKTVSAGTHSTRAEAEQAGWALALKYIDDPEERAKAQSTITLEQWSTQWLGGLASEVKTSTIDTYRWRIEKWIIPHLGSKKLVDLTPGVIRRWLDDLSHLSHRSKKSALTCLSSCLTAARDRGLCDNPCSEVTLKQSKAKKASDKQKIRTWSDADAKKLLATGDATVFLGLYGGLRRGEILGLEWVDVDWIEGTVKVSRNVVQTAYQILDDETPKNGASRTVHLPPAAITALALWKDAQEVLEPSERVVGNITPSQAAKAFTRLCKAAGVPDLQMHSMRHHCASTMLSQGVSLVAVSKHLGHSSATVTLDFYGHFMPQDTGRCAEALAAVYATPVNPGQATLINDPVT